MINVGCVLKDDHTPALKQQIWESGYLDDTLSIVKEKSKVLILDTSKFQWHVADTIRGREDNADNRPIWWASSGELEEREYAEWQRGRCTLETNFMDCTGFYFLPPHINTV